MPAPSPSPSQWANDANYTNGPEAGNPTKVTPSTGVQNEGWIPNDKLYPQWLNWWQNLVGLWVDWLESERSRLASYIGGASGSDEWAYPSARAREVLVGPHQGGAEAGWALGSLIDRATCSTGGADMMIDLNAFLPSGAVLNKVEAYVKPESTALMDLKVYASAVAAEMDSGTPGDPTDTQVGATGQSDGSNAYQNITVDDGAGGDIGHTVDKSANNLVAWVKASSAAAGAEAFFGLRLTFDDPGPRNY